MEGLVPISKYMLSLETFPVRETTLQNGLRIYLRCTVGEYFTDEQIQRLCDTLRALRMRPTDISSFPRNLCKVVSNKGEIKSRFIQRKSLRKDELAILLYNIAPYALLNRKETALMAKSTFPAFFASTGTIYSTFTKYLNAPVTERGNDIYFTITNLPYHSTVKLEEDLIKLSVEYTDI